MIRGLPQVRSEFNGRDSFNANSSRGLSFADVSPELMAGVDTYKNATADMIEGGIAGTVNLRTHVPFDSEGFVAAFSAEIGYGTLAEEAKPAGSMLLSNRWDTGIGEFGVMLNAAYSEVITESQGVQLLRFFNATNVEAYGGGTKWIPGGIDLRKNTYDRTRKGASLAAQYRSPEDSLLTTLQYNRSEYDNDWEEYSLTAGVGDSQQPQDIVLTDALGSRAGRARRRTSSTAVAYSCAASSTTSVNGWAGPEQQQRSITRMAIHHGSNGSRSNWFCYTWSTTALPEHARRGTRCRYALRDTENMTAGPVVEPALGRERACRPELRRPEDRLRRGQLRQQRQQQDRDEPRPRHQWRQAEVPVPRSPRATA